MRREEALLHRQDEIETRRKDLQGKREKMKQDLIQATDK